MDPWITRRLAGEVHVGIGDTTGLVGVALDFSPWSVLGLNLGIGYGWAGPQYAFTPRFRVHRWLRARVALAPYLGAGVSAGAYDQPSFVLYVPVSGDPAESPSPHRNWAMAYWVNCELGLEIRVIEALVLRPHAGVSMLLNPGDSTMVRGGYGELPTGSIGRWQPYVGMAVGYALPIP